jgi:hypothetical protein
MNCRGRQVFTIVAVLGLHLSRPIASAETFKGVLKVTASVAPTCTISASSITLAAHGPNTSIGRGGSGVITSSCNSGASSRITVEEVAAAGQMTSEIHKMTYGVDSNSVNSGCTTVGGKTSAAPTIVCESVAVQRLAFYVHVSPRNSLFAGSEYSAIVATVSF